MENYPEFPLISSEEADCEGEEESGQEADYEGERENGQTVTQAQPSPESDPDYEEETSAPSE